jgi:hypothetical protein
VIQSLIASTVTGRILNMFSAVALLTLGSAYRGRVSGLQELDDREVKKQTGGQLQDKRSLCGTVQLQVNIRLIS